MNKSNQPAKKTLFISIKTIVFITLLFSLLATTTADAAKIALTPDSIGVAIQQGEERKITVSTYFYETSRPSSYVNFNINSSGGNIPSSWVINNTRVTLNTTQPTKEVSFSIKVPANATTGTHRSIFIPVVSRSSERVSFNNLTLYVEVMPSNTCKQPPIISETTTDQQIVSNRNNKLLTLTFTGSINSSIGCTTNRAWYQLSDEYGEMNKIGTMELDVNGNFTVSIPVITSRKGNDKDGRLYNIIFGAENEVGTVFGGQQEVLISHDNRKK